MRSPRAIARRAVKLLLVVVIVAAVSMLLLDLLPGNPAVAILGEFASPERVEALSRQLGVDDPFLTRLASWGGDILRGDLGRSINTGQPISEILLARLPATLELAVGSLIVALIISFPLSVLSARRPDGWVDRCTRVGASFLLSIPSFLLAVLLVLLLSVQRHVFPVSGWVGITDDPLRNLRYAFLPVLTLALVEAAAFTRVLRNDLADTLQQDFVLSARSRGLHERTVLFRHALRPSSFSLVTVAGVSLGRLLGGTVVMETIFGIPGIGFMTVQAIQARDFIVVRSVVLMASLAYILINTIVDAIYPLLDPRVTRARA